MLHFEGTLEETVKVGHLFVLTGKISPALVDRFVVNLRSQGSTADSGNIHLHLSARFRENAIVRNNLTIDMEHWDMDAEERNENLLPNNERFPFAVGDKFKVAIYVDKKAFCVTLNEKPFCIFPHRLPFATIEIIELFGDLEVIYQVDHFNSLELFKKSFAIDGSYTGSLPKNIPEVQQASVEIFAVPMGNPEGAFIFCLYDAQATRRLFHLEVNLLNESITMNSQNKKLSWKEDFSQSPKPFPIFLNNKVKLVLKFTNDNFLHASINGILLRPYQLDESSLKIYKTISFFSLYGSSELKMEFVTVNHIQRC